MGAITFSTTYLGITWFCNRFVFSKNAIFIWGLILSYSLAEYAVVNILIDYLGDKRHLTHELSLRESAMIVNLIDGGSAVFVVFITHISEAYKDRFNTIRYCTTAYALGLFFLWVTEKSPSKFYLFYVAVALTALGKAAKDPPLQSFLEFQLSKKALNGDDEEEELRIEISTVVWWKTAWITGAAIAIFVFGNASWQNTFLICGVVMAVSYLSFNFGYNYYHCEKPTGSPLTSIYRVFKAALLKRNHEYPNSADKYYWKDQRPNPKYLYSEKPGELRLFPRAPFPFKFLDKAAILMEEAIVRPKMQEEKGELFTVKEVRGVKSLTPMVYLRFCFIAYSLVVASGNTYFVEQEDNLEGHVGGFKIPVSFLFVLKSFVRDVVIFLFWWFGSTKQGIIVRRTIAGMFCAVLCCIVAWQVEHHRLCLIKREGAVQDPKKILPMSILWLTPQYFLLGLMEGLAESGLEKFFYSNVPKSMRSFEQPFCKTVLSIGKFFSIPCVLIFGNWFKETINSSRLDKYFLMLAILCCVFLCIYLIYLYYFSQCNFMAEHEELSPMEQAPEAIHDVAEEESGSLPAPTTLEEGIRTPKDKATMTV